MRAKAISGSQPTELRTSVGRWVVASIFLSFSLIGWWVYRLPVLETTTFFLGVLIAFYIPGALLVRTLQLKADNALTLPVIALATGSIIVPMVYRLLRWSLVQDVWLMMIIGSVSVFWFYRVFISRHDNLHVIPVKIEDYRALAMLLVMILILLHISHFSDLILGPQGFLFRTHHMSESVFHLGLVNALTEGYPPPAIYASGSPDFSSYHLNMHLQIELLHRLFGLDPLKLVHFYFPLLYFCLLVALPFVFIRESGGTPITGLVGSLVVFGADLSFLAAFFIHSESSMSWTTVFQTNIWSLFTLNGYLPALIALFLSIFLFRDFLSSKGASKAILIGFVAYAAFGLKSSMGLQLAASTLTIGALMVLSKNQRKKGSVLFLVSSMALLFMVLDMMFVRSSVGNNTVAFEPMNHLNSIVERLGYSNVPLDWIIPLALLLLLVGMGGRVFGVFYLVNNLKSGEETDWNLALIGLFFIIGYVVTEFFVIGNSAGQNNAIWFYLQSLVASWFLLFPFLISLQNRKAAYSVVTAIVLLASLPSTIQFLTIRASDQYLGYGPDEMQLIGYMNTTDPQSIFLHPLSEGEPSLAANFAGRQTVLSTWVSFVTENEGLSERTSDIQTFFDQETSSAERMTILNKYSVDFVYGPATTLQIMDELPNVSEELASGSLVLYRIK